MSSVPEGIELTSVLWLDYGLVCYEFLTRLYLQKKFWFFLYIRCLLFDIFLFELLEGVEFGVVAGLGEEFLVGAVLGDLVVFEDDYFVGVA